MLYFTLTCCSEVGNIRNVFSFPAAFHMSGLLLHCTTDVTPRWGGSTNIESLVVWHLGKYSFYWTQQPLSFHRLFKLKVKLSPKSNQSFICDRIWVKPSHKCKITTKEALYFYRFTVVSFSGKLIFNGVQGQSYTSIKIAIFKTLRRLDTM